MVSKDKMEKMISQLISEKALKTPEIIEAFSFIDRKDFVPIEHQISAYKDCALPIGYGQTISQPYTVAFMLELLGPKEKDKILDVGSGSGWTTALLSKIVGEKGKVFGLERIPELVDFGKKNLLKYGFNNYKIMQAKETLGLSEEAPFDKILVSATAQDLPQDLIDQLRIGGIMVIPIKDAILKIVKLSENKTDTQKFIGFAFVPLIE